MSAPEYSERLAPPWWVVAGVLVVAVLCGATVHSGYGGARAVVPYVVFLAVALIGLAVVARGQVRVHDGVLHVPGARIGLDQLGGVTPLDREATRRLRGPMAEPRAFVVTRSWLSRAVRVQIEDPGDDTPYWLVGTRRPQALAAALQSLRHDPLDADHAAEEDVRGL